MQAQPVLDQLNDNFVRHKPAASKRFSSLLPERCAEISFTAQDSARRRNRNAEVARNHFRLGSFARAGRTKKNKPPFHYRSIARKEKWRPRQSPARQSPRTATSASRLLLPRRGHTKRDQMIAPESGPCAKTHRNAAESGVSPPGAWYRA